VGSVLERLEDEVCHLYTSILLQMMLTLLYYSFNSRGYLLNHSIEKNIPKVLTT